MSESQFFIEQARNDLLSYSVYNDREFSILNHHEIIAESLEKVRKGEIKNLIISMPPASGKSRIMREFISYLLGKEPFNNILYTGHTVGFLEDFSREILDRIMSDEYKTLFPNTKLKLGSSAVNKWQIEKGGKFKIFGVGGGITGARGHYLIVDDPYATREQAESDTVRRKVSEWYWSTFSSRKENSNVRKIIIMQRWREDDLVGELLERQPGKWTELKIPALNEKDESFWPEKFTNKDLMEMRELNPLYFSSQYQQEPYNEGGGDFLKEYFEYYEFEEIQDKLNSMQVYTFVDPAISQKQEADNTAIVTIGVYNNYTYLLEVKKMKENPDKIIDEIFETVKKFKNLGHSYKLGIENVQYQKMLILEVQKQMRIRDNFFTLEEVRPSGEKEARIRTTLQGRYSGHTIIHPKYGPNIKEFEAELLKFPNGKHDDMIDACAGAVAMSTVKLNRKPQKAKKVKTSSLM